MKDDINHREVIVDNLMVRAVLPQNFNHGPIQLGSDSFSLQKKLIVKLVGGEPGTYALA